MTSRLASGELLRSAHSKIQTDAREACVIGLTRITREDRPPGLEATVQRVTGSMTRKTDEIVATEKQIAQRLVDQVRDDLLRSCRQEARPDPNPDGEFD